MLIIGLFSRLALSSKEHGYSFSSLYGRVNLIAILWDYADKVVHTELAKELVTVKRSSLSRDTSILLFGVIQTFQNAT